VSLDRAGRSFLALTVIAVFAGAASVWGGLAGVLEPLIRVEMSGAHRPGQLASGMLVALLVIVVATGAALGLRSVTCQAIASIRLSRRVRALRVCLTDDLVTAADDVGLTGRVVLVDDPAPSCYVCGVFRPRVVVGRRTLTLLPGPQLRAVLEHERYHVLNLDPLRLVVVRVIRSTLFMLPALEALHRRYLTGRELAADARAVTACGREPLVAALHQLVAADERASLGIEAGIASPDSLPARVHQLESGRLPRPEAPNHTRVVCSLAVIAALATAFLASIWGLGGPTAVRQATGTGLGSALLLATASCAVPFAVVGILGYTMLALAARRPLAPH
jgi:beta-lactamase regulating signal transducer with metallopeptidase domain